MPFLNDKDLDAIPCKYTLKKHPLGTGSYATVYEAKNTVSDMHYAVKQYSKKLVYGLEDMLHSELEVLKKLSRAHPNILTLVDSFETSNYLYLVTDLATGGELFSRVVDSVLVPDQCGHLSEKHTIEVVRTLLSAVTHLHANNVVHRDLKAENLLFQTKHSSFLSILVADFGTARIIRRNEDGTPAKLHDVSGTLSYMAPETLDRSKGHLFEVDMWAVGVLAYFMLCGYMPFDCETDDETKEAISKADYSFEPSEYWAHISENATSFIRSCFETEPARRLTASDALLHSWIVDHSRPPSVAEALSSSSYSLSANGVPSRSKSLAKLGQSLENLQLPCMGQANSSRLSQANLEAFLTAHSNTSLNSKLSLMELSRYASLAEGTTLQGSYCESPDMLSNFNSPLASEHGSRQQSHSNLRALGEVGTPESDTLLFCNKSSKSTFII